jgi:hypothetical protein
MRINDHPVRRLDELNLVPSNCVSSPRLNAARARHSTSLNFLGTAAADLRQDFLCTIKVPRFAIRRHTTGDRQC